MKSVRNRPVLISRHSNHWSHAGTNRAGSPTLYHNKDILPDQTLFGFLVTPLPSLMQARTVMKTITTLKGGVEGGVRVLSSSMLVTDRVVSRVSKEMVAKSAHPLLAHPLVGPPPNLYVDLYREKSLVNRYYGNF